MSMALNHKLVLEGASEVSDGAGGSTQVWSALGTLWGRIDGRTGGLTEGSAGTVSAIVLTVWVRAAPVGHSGRPMAGQRFVTGGRVLRIDAVTEEEPRGLYLRCACTEEVSA